MKKPSGPMPVSERAKQFAPFSALRGLPEELLEIEKVRVPRRTLSEEAETRLNAVLSSLLPRDEICAVYYSEHEEEYVTVTGKVRLCDTVHRTLLVDDTMIKFGDLLAVKKH